MSPEEPSSQIEQPSTAAKIADLCREIQQLVSGGHETPRFELTRMCSLASTDKKSQADFAKTIQGLANAHPPSERVYVIGADQAGKKFFSIENPQEFDQANVRQILEKYLEPLPLFNVLVMEAEDGARFAAIVVAAEQPRPIVVKNPTGDGKTQFWEWVTSGSRSRLA